MPSVLSELDKETVRRKVPKAVNKIVAVAMVRLYVAYPNRQQWTYTGLQGAAVLANDLVGNTFWIKLVDVSPANRGVIWDQEIYEPFYYNQDRTFFHSFELEDCLAGFSFVDDKEAKTFRKKMDEREKAANKATRANAFQGSGHRQGQANGGGGHGKSPGIFSSLLRRPSSTVTTQQPTSIIPSKQQSSQESSDGLNGQNDGPKSGISALDEVDPSWRSMLSELLEMGITEDQIEENADFIKDWIERKQATENLNDASDANDERQIRAPPPPPPPPQSPLAGLKTISPQHTGNRRGPPPVPPPARRARLDSVTPAVPLLSGQNSPPRLSLERTPSPPRPKFRAPPPLADAGRFASSNAPPPPLRPRATSQNNAPGPPPPPRPPKTPLDDEPRFNVPPPFKGERLAAPPAAPQRVNGPPPPPRITMDSAPSYLPPAQIAPPALPPKTPHAPSASPSPPSPPPPMPVRNPLVPPAQPLRPRSSTPVDGAPPALPTQPRSSPAPAPPPLPNSQAPSPPPLPSTHAPPPPPMPNLGSSGPPLPPGRDNTSTPSLPTPAAGKSDLLASIRASGGLGNARLKKVGNHEKHDRSAAAVPGSDAAIAASSGGGGMAQTLTAALMLRNKKVSASNDEDDEDDEGDWDDGPGKI